MTARNLAEYSFEPHRIEIDGYGLNYLDEGQGPEVVMVHGNPSWSYLYRNLVSGLRDHYRCIVPDHLGCGFSDKPARTGWKVGRIAAAWAELMRGLGYTRYVAQGGDWGAAITTARLDR